MGCNRGSGRATSGKRPAAATAAGTTNSPSGGGKTGARQTVRGKTPAKPPSGAAKYWKLGVMVATCLLVAGALMAVMQHRTAAARNDASSQPVHQAVTHPVVFREPAKPTITETV